jgi:hypothetical protein
MLNLDLTNTPTSSGFDLLQAGEYVVTCDDATVKETKNGTGEYINCKFAVCQGDKKGRILFNMFNIKNANAKAVEIGLQQLKAFLVASEAPSMNIKSASDLCGLTCIAIVKIKTDDFGEKNVISYFKKIADAKITVDKKDETPF